MVRWCRPLTPSFRGVSESLRPTEWTPGHQSYVVRHSKQKEISFFPCDSSWCQVSFKKEAAEPPGRLLLCAEGKSSWSSIDPINMAKCLLPPGKMLLMSSLPGHLSHQHSEVQLPTPGYLLQNLPEPSRASWHVHVTGRNRERFTKPLMPWAKALRNSIPSPLIPQRISRCLGPLGQLNDGP